MQTPQSDSIKDGPMSGLQKRVIALCVALNMLDGFDVLAAAFVAPSLSRDWGIAPSALGLVLSAGPVGMAVGSMVLSPFADRFGRRGVLVLSMALMGLGMIASAFAADVASLSLWRVVTGFGIGGALASAGALAAEFSSRRKQAFNISLYVAGYPIGATLGGLAAAPLIQAFGWPSVFILGGLLSVIMVPLLWWGMPESVEFLQSRGTEASRRRAEAILSKMGKTGVGAVTAGAEQAPAARPVWSRTVIVNTILLCVAYFFVMQAVYFVLQWTPKVLVDAGLSLQSGISGGALMNLGGIVGSAVFGFVTLRFGLRSLEAATCVATFLMIALFAVAPVTLWVTLTLAFVVGILAFASMTGLYAIAPLVYEPSMRATGLGVALSMGRVGAIAGPILTGFLIEQGWPRWAFSLALTGPILISAVAVMRLRLNRP